ncbi:MAG: asparagine synthase C-terminal domain-containing protein, partial [Bacteroidales bacterium]|nr:asparagine synthase C-terminal domain-containing protein [Bacteroidales bacterium]
MSGYLLSSQGDRMIMANSVEGRYPFLDHRVIEFCGALPSDYKMKGLNEKYLLKKMMQKRLPESILKRPKQPYRAPVATSFFSNSAQNYISELLHKKDLDNTGIFSAEAIQKLLDKTRTSQMVTEMENMSLAGIISTQLVYHQFILRDKYRPLPNVLNNCRIYYEKNPVYT